jgi:hypothetical protein
MSTRSEGPLTSRSEAYDRAKFMELMSTPNVLLKVSSDGAERKLCGEQNPQTFKQMGDSP